MKELIKDGAKIAEAINVLHEAGLLAWEKNQAEDAQATLTFMLREPSGGNGVVVLSASRYDEIEDEEMAVDLTYYRDTDAHVFREIHARTVYGEKPETLEVGASRRVKK